MSYKIKNPKGIRRLGSLLFIVVILGCTESFLIDENEKDLTREIVFSGDVTAVAAVTGVYDGFQNDSEADPGVPSEYNVKGIFKMANNIALDIQDNNKRSESQYFRFDLDVDGDIPVKIWPNNYRQIGRANFAIEGIQKGLENGSLTTSLANRLLGEVLVLRAISYQYLAAVYGGVPLMLKTTDDFFKERDTQDAVFEQIVIDASNAIDKLPWSYDTEKGRVSRGTAYAVLGNAHMWLGQYAEAVVAFDSIEVGGVTKLEDNYLDIHALANPNGVESLFELQWAANANLSWDRNDEVNILQLFAMPTDLTGGGGFAGIPTKEFYDSFEPGDLRRQATVIAPGEEHPDTLINISQYRLPLVTGTVDNPDTLKDVDGNVVFWNTLGSVADPWTGAALGAPEDSARTGYWGVKSWRDPNIGGWGSSQLFGGQGHIWIRYGEVLLSLAESALKSGQTAKAQAAFDRVRNRAWGGTAPAKTVTMDNILQEYRHELGGEFSLWPILRRSGDATKYMLNTHGVTIPAGKELVPIPNAVLSANPNIKPNP